MNQVAVDSVVVNACSYSFAVSGLRDQAVAVAEACVWITLTRLFSAVTSFRRVDFLAVSLQQRLRPASVPRWWPLGLAQRCFVGCSAYSGASAVRGALWTAAMIMASPNEQGQRIANDIEAGANEIERPAALLLRALTPGLLKWALGDPPSHVPYPSTTPVNFGV